LSSKCSLGEVNQSSIIHHTFINHSTLTVAEDAVFLKEVKMVGDGEFEATKVSLEEAKEIANNVCGAYSSTPLFIVHGFDVEPSNSLKYNYDNFKGDKDYYPLPVIWASVGKTTSTL